MNTTSGPVRMPLQKRSRASLERMLVATEGLLVESGNGAFTLNELTKSGAISIGAIYSRFGTRDDLVRAVQSRVLERVNAELISRIARIEAQPGDLNALVRRLIDALAVTLYENAHIMRPLMQHAAADPTAAMTGKIRYAEAADAFETALLARRASIRRPDPERAVKSAFRIGYSAIARYLGFGSLDTASGENDWTVLTDDLSSMISAFLLTGP